MLLPHIITKYYNKIISKITDSISSCSVQFGFQKTDLPYNSYSSLLIRSSPVTLKLMLFILTFARLLIPAVCRNQLLVKLWSAGTSGWLWSWFRSNLSDRSQFFVINNKPSSLLPVLSGVPQGSILGPLLFLIYINDIFYIIPYTYFCRWHQMLWTCTDEQLLQHHIDLLLNWSSQSYLCFNPSKCVHISFRANSITSYHLNKQLIPKVKSHWNLGVILSDDLTWRNHYTYILSKAYKTLNLIHHAFKSSHSLSIKTKLYMTLVCSTYVH